MAKNGHKCQKMAKRCPKMSKTGKKKPKIAMAKFEKFYVKSNLMGLKIEFQIGTLFQT